MKLTLKHIAPMLRAASQGDFEETDKLLLEAGSYFKPHFGLCSNFLFFLEDLEDTWIVENVFPNWEHFSGIASCPIPDPDGRRDPYAVYQHNKDNVSLWQGKYGELRKDLARHIAEAIEKHLTE